jgi:two-component system chemotaxis sensor kinase CheA
MATSNYESTPEQACAELTESLSNACAAQLDRLQHGVEATCSEVDEITRILKTLQENVSPYEISSLNKTVEQALLLLDALRTEPHKMSTDALLSFNELGELIFKFAISPTEEELPKLYEQCNTLIESFLQQMEISQNTPSLPSPEKSQAPENPAPLDATERAAFQKYQSRSEDLFVVLFPKGVHESAASVTASDVFDNLARVAEIFLVRAVDAGAIILFAAELPDTVLADIAGVPVRAVPKATPFSELESPWKEFQFQENSNSQKPPSTSAISTRASTESPQNVQETPQTEISQQTKNNAEPEEDFDGPNLAQPASLDSVDTEMLHDFLANAEELMEQLSESVLALENDPTSKDAIEQIFRTAHTIKGTAGMFGFRAIQRLTHVMENLFDQVRKGQLLANSSHIDAVLFGFDRVRVMFDLLKKNQPAEIAINDALARLNASLRGETLPPATKGPQVATTTEPAPQQNQQDGKSAPQAAAPQNTKPPTAPKKDDASASLRVDLKRLDSLVNLVGELVIDRTRFAGIEEIIRTQGQNSELLHAMSEAVLLFGRHMNEVQSIIMKIRMVPVGNAFTKFARMVRDLSRDCGKEVDLQIEGGEAELDKTLVEEIGDPLVHLIRNSVDHGIEPPDDREKAGKPRRGSILLQARQDSNMIVITIKDDGRGLQVEKLRKKALQNGLIKENEVLTDKETFNLIFEAGFSTAEKVTNISGRGVGMDVVKKNITKLKGVIELDSELGRGTTTTIKLPLTLAIIPSLMIDVSGESYAIPLVNVVESLRISPDDIQRVGAVDFVKLREKAMPLLYMSKMFGIDDPAAQSGYRKSETRHTPAEQEASHDSKSESLAPTLSTGLSARRMRKPGLLFVVVGVGERRVGVVVDQLLGQQEIVIKSLGQILPKPQGIAGGCVLGNGKVALVLDIGEIIDEMGRGRVKGVYHE